MAMHVFTHQQLMTLGVLALALFSIPVHTQAQLYSNPHTISGNNVGINVSNPSASLHIKERWGAGLGSPGQNNFTITPMIRLQTQSGPNTSPLQHYHWEIGQKLSSSIYFTYQLNNGTKTDKYIFGQHKFNLAVNELLLNNNIQLASGAGPFGIQSHYAAFGTKKAGIIWQGSGAIWFHNQNGLQLAFTQGTVTTQAQLNQQVKFSILANGDMQTTGKINPTTETKTGNVLSLNIPSSFTGDSRYTDLAFTDPNSAGSEKRLFVVRTIAGNHSAAPNTMMFWSPQNKGNAWFNLPVRIGGSVFDDEKITPDYKLYVSGGIRTERVQIDHYTSWGDYVFEDAYELKPLDEVANFVNEHHHLPGIPDAETIATEGFEVSDMQAKQMVKIEELTLYLIELQAELKEVKAKLAKFEK